MRIAYIILAHKNPDQIIRLVKRLDKDGSTFLIHIDRKAKNDTYKHVFEDLGFRKNVLFLDRAKVFWGDFSQVSVTLEALNQLIERNFEFDYVKLLSGQDYPIKTNECIDGFLASHQNKSFLENFPLPDLWWLKNGEPSGGLDRFKYLHFRLASRVVRTPIPRTMPTDLEPFGGSAYWMLSQECAFYLYDFARSNSRLVQFFRGTGNSDEIFFQTVIMNSPLKAKIVNNDLTYTDWPEKSPSPKVLESLDLDNLRQSPCLFARKFDIKIDKDVFYLLDSLAT